MATRSPQLDEQQLGQLTTSFHWRHRFLTAPLGTKTKAVTGIVEASETFIRKSAKGSRTLKDQAPRKRATKATKAARSMDEHDAVLIVRDRHGAATDAVLADLTASTFEAVLRPIVAKDAVLVSDGCHAYGLFAKAAGIVQFLLVARRGERTYGGFHIQIVSACTSRLKGWLARFRGVASRLLPNYLGWRLMIEREGSHLAPRDCLALAIG